MSRGFQKEKGYEKRVLAAVLAVGMLLSGCQAKQQQKQDQNVFSAAQMNQDLLTAAATLPRSGVLSFEEGLDAPEIWEDWLTYWRGVRDNDLNGNGDPTDEIPIALSQSSDGERSLTLLLRSSVLYLLLVVALLLGLFLLVGGLLRRARRSQQENEQLKIVGALSNDYFDVFLAEPLQDTAVVIKGHAKVIRSDKRTVNSYREEWERFAAQYVLQEDAQAVLDGVSAENLCAAMQ